MLEKLRKLVAIWDSISRTLSNIHLCAYVFYLAPSERLEPRISKTENRRDILSCTAD